MAVPSDVAEPLQPAENLALLRLGVRRVAAGREKLQDLERAQRPVHTPGLGRHDLDLGPLGRLVARARDAARGAHVHLDHALEERPCMLTVGAAVGRHGDDRGDAVARQRGGDEGDAAGDAVAPQRLDARRAAVERLGRDAPDPEPGGDRVGDVHERNLIRPRDPYREAGAHDVPAATPGKRPGRKMTFRSFTTSWSFRKSSTACARTLASSARPRAFTSSSVSSPTRMWKTSWRMTGPASSCSVTKCAVQPETRTPSSHACLYAFEPG